MRRKLCLISAIGRESVLKKGIEVYEDEDEDNGHRINAALKNTQHHDVKFVS